RSRFAKVLLGGLRLTLLLLLIAMLNRPVLALSQSRVQPSVLAVLVDESISMIVKDGQTGTELPPMRRLDRVVDFLSTNDQAMLKRLAEDHQLRFYRFSSDAQRIDASDVPQVVQALTELKPEGRRTQVLPSIETVLRDLQGQRVAGVVVLTDGRETPAQSSSGALESIKEYGVKVFPIAVGSEDAPKNIEIASINVQDSAFAGDLVNLKTTIRINGYASDYPVRVTLVDDKT